MRLNVDFLCIFLLAIVAGLAELNLSEWDQPIFMKVAEHFVVVNICLAFAAIFVYWGRDTRFVLLLTILVACMGPMGAALCLLTMLLYLIYLTTGENVKDFLASLFPESGFSHTETLYERIAHGLDRFDPDYNPLPFMDVIEFGTEKQKRSAIEKILRYYRPEFSPALLKALDDPSNGIRVLAATAVNTLDKHMFEKYLEMEEALESDPTNLDLVLEFANHCDLYVQSKLLDESRSGKVTYHAIQSYREVLNAQPRNFDVMEKLSRLYVQKGKYNNVLGMLEPLLDQIGTARPDLLKWYMASLYYLKRYEELGEFANDHFAYVKDVAAPYELKERVFAWSGKYG